MSITPFGPARAFARRTSTSLPARAIVMAVANLFGSDLITLAHRKLSVMGWQFLWPLNCGKLAVRLPHDLRGIQPQEFALPPVSGLVFFFHRGKPVLPQHRFYVAWRLLAE